MTYRARRRGRAAFTLIELLVVIAIIAILVSLTAAAVMRALVKGPELATKADISEMDQKLSSVKSQFNLDYLPSRLHLSKQNNYNTTNPVGANYALDTASVKYLTARFGRHGCYNLAPLSGATFIDWNGDGVASEELFLEGEQCLVFHLGGIPTYNNGVIGMTGFSSNIQNPAQAGGSRQAPFFEFQANRLRLPNSAGPYTAASASGGQFPFYIDAWNTILTPAPAWGRGMPYAFFATTNIEGGAYNSDCPTLNVAPYFSGTSPTTQWLNPGSWQIISAGADAKFGLGGLWVPTGPTVSAAGQDDQANFSPRKLGFAAN